MEPIAVSSGFLREFYFHSDVFTRLNAIGQRLSSAFNRHTEFRHSGYHNARPAGSRISVIIGAVKHSSNSAAPACSIEPPSRQFNFLLPVYRILSRGVQL